MTSSKNTKRALLASVLSVALCCAMLIGSTFAWFTDRVTSGKNQIVAGNLDVELEYAVPGADGIIADDAWKTVEDAEDIFNPNALWEPGYTEVAYLRVSNLGSLALKYKFAMNIDSETPGTNAAGEEFKLSSYLKYGVAEGQETAFADRDAAIAAVEGNATALTGYSKDGKLAAGADPVYMALVVYMPKEVGNKANYKTGTVAPSIDLGITLVATQDKVESDSFGNDYDANATYDQVTVTPDGNAEENGNALAEAIQNVEDGGTVFVPAGTYALPTIINLGDKEVVLQGTAGTVLNPTDEGLITIRGSEDAKLTVRDMSFTGPALRGLCFSGQQNSNAALIVENCSFEDLTTGIYLGGVANATITGCTFKNYTAGIGGTEDITGTLTVDNCTFEGNGETIGWAGTGELVITNCPTCDSYMDYTKEPAEEVIIKKTVSNAEEFEAALEDSGEILTVYLSNSGTYALANGVAKGKDITIVGTKDTVVDICQDLGGESGNSGMNYQDGAQLTFKGVTVKGQSSGDFGGIVRAQVTFEDCVIQDTFTLYGDTVFKNCTLESATDRYNVWTWGASKVEFTDCTFNTAGKAILVYGGEHTDVIVSGCTFNDSSNGTVGKAAIETGNDYGATYNITINNIVVNGFAENTQSGSKIWGNKNNMTKAHLNVVIDGVDVY